MAAAVDYLESLGRDAISAHEETITSYALEGLESVPNLRVLGPRRSKDRIPVFAFDVAGIAAEDILRAWMHGESRYVRAICRRCPIEAFWSQRGGACVVLSLHNFC